MYRYVLVPMDALKASLDLKDDAAVKAFVSGAGNGAWTLGAGGLEVAGTGEVATITQGKDSEVLAFAKLDPIFTAKPLVSRPV